MDKLQLIKTVFPESPRSEGRKLKKLEVGADILAYFDLDMNGATTV